MPDVKKKSARLPRLDQLLAGLGYGSRKEMNYAVEDGLVTVSGVEKLRSDMRVDPEAVLFHGEPLDHPLGLLVLINKPTGYTCSHSEEEGRSVYELLPERWNFRKPQVVSVGRLDKDTSGLLLLTDQHDLVHRLTSPKRHVSKVYEATLAETLPKEAVEIFASGALMLRGEAKPCLPAELEILGERKARVTLHEGRYHQVRRMFASLGNAVLKLERIQFGKLTLAELPEGAFRVLLPSIDEVLG